MNKPVVTGGRLTTQGGFSSKSGNTSWLLKSCYPLPLGIPWLEVAMGGEGVWVRKRLLVGVKSAGGWIPPIPWGWASPTKGRRGWCHCHKIMAWAWIVDTEWSKDGSECWESFDELLACPLEVRSQCFRCNTHTCTNTDRKKKVNTSKHKRKNFNRHDVQK